MRYRFEEEQSRGGSSQPRVRLNLNRSGSRGNLLSTFKLSKNAIALGNTQDAAYVIDEAGVGIASQDNDIPDHVASARGGGGHATVSKGRKKWRREGPSKSVVGTTLSFLQPGDGAREVDQVAVV